MKRISTVFSIFLTTAMLICSPTFAQNTDTICTTPFVQSNMDFISPRADVIKWKYKAINGKLYKRLYNHTTEEWIGDWELVSSS